MSPKKLATILTILQILVVFVPAPLIGHGTVLDYLMMANSAQHVELNEYEKLVRSIASFGLFIGVLAAIPLIMIFRLLPIPDELMVPMVITLSVVINFAAFWLFYYSCAKLVFRMLGKSTPGSS